MLSYVQALVLLSIVKGDSPSIGGKDYHVLFALLGDRYSGYSLVGESMDWEKITHIAPEEGRETHGKSLLIRVIRSQVGVKDPGLAGVCRGGLLVDIVRVALGDVEPDFQFTGLGVIETEKPMPVSQPTANDLLFAGLLIGRNQLSDQATVGSVPIEHDYVS